MGGSHGKAAYGISQCSQEILESRQRPVCTKGGADLTPSLSILLVCLELWQEQRHRWEAGPVLMPSALSYVWGIVGAEPYHWKNGDTGPGWKHRKRVSSWPYPVRKHFLQLMKYKSSQTFQGSTTCTPSPLQAIARLRARRKALFMAFIIRLIISYYWLLERPGEQIKECKKTSFLVSKKNVFQLETMFQKNQPSIV